MANLYHVEGKSLVKTKKGITGVVHLFDGDVYVFEEGQKLYIWLGKDCSVEEKCVAAWVSNTLDKGKDFEVETINQGREPEEFNYTLNVMDGNTPGFLTHALFDMVEYKLYRIATTEDTIYFDETSIEEVELSKDSLESDNVFVLDANENIYVWFGNGANTEERYDGKRFARSIDKMRNYAPLVYTIYEGDGGKSEKAFYELLDKAKEMGPVVSVEDRREASY